MAVQCTQPSCPALTDTVRALVTDGTVRALVSTFDTDGSGVLSQLELWAVCKARDVLKRREAPTDCKLMRRAGETVDQLGCRLAQQSLNRPSVRDQRLVARHFAKSTVGAASC